MQSNEPMTLLGERINGQQNIVNGKLLTGDITLLQSNLCIFNQNIKYKLYPEYSIQTKQKKLIYSVQES